MEKDLILEIEEAIHETISRMKKRKNGPSADWMDSFSKMVNSYRRLKECGKEGWKPEPKIEDDIQKLNPNLYV